jgi:hypothetical protein
MSGTRRTLLTRLPVGQITPGAVDLFVAMGKLRCTCADPRPLTEGPCPGCTRWYSLHDELHRALACRPWEYPCVARQRPRGAGSPSMTAEIRSRMEALQAAAERGGSRGRSEHGTDGDLRPARICPFRINGRAAVTNGPRSRSRWPKQAQDFSL